MQAKEMPKEVSIMGGCPLPALPLSYLVLAEVEAEGKAKAPRLRAQQRGKVAKGKKGRLERFLRSLWGKTIPYPANSQRIEVCRPRLRPHNSREADSAALARAGKREGQPRGAVPQLPPEKEAR